jgi:ABC-type branched-subunit amino acid transport system substrate-binding protein
MPDLSSISLRSLTDTPKRSISPVLIIVYLALCFTGLAACQLGARVTNTRFFGRPTLRLGSVLALEGQEEAVGNDMRVGLEAAFDGETIKGQKIELLIENDYYDPSVSSQKTKILVDSDIFLMIGNVGTSTAEQTVPILSEHQVPMVGFFTGAGLLRSGSELIVNYRASYAQEITAVIELALAANVQPNQICAYVQGDGYGMSGLRGLRQALSQAKAEDSIVQRYDRILEQSVLEHRSRSEKCPQISGS